MKREALLAGLVCAALGFTWQALTVHYNYGGNWTALFCHGSKYPPPASLAGEHIYVFPNSGGYDGQSYHYVAHDPLCRTDVCRAVPDPSLRYPRILVPGLAHVFALGRAEWIDGAYFAWNLVFLFLGAYWLALLCGRPALAVLYVLAPASLISLDRMVVDLALTSLCLGFAVYVGSGSRGKLYAVIMAAALCREAGFLLLAAYALWLIGRREYRGAAVFATSIVPAAAWMFWVRAHVPGGSAADPASLIPLRGLIDAVLHPRVYSAGAVWIRALEVIQLAGLLWGMALGLREARVLLKDPVRAACFLFAALAILLPPGVYDDPYAGARILSPMLLFEFLNRQRLPLLLATPRVWLQLAPQVWGVIRGLM